MTQPSRNLAVTPFPLKYMDHAKYSIEVQTPEVLKNLVSTFCEPNNFMLEAQQIIREMTPGKMDTYRKFYKANEQDEGKVRYIQIECITMQFIVQQKVVV